jgi:hypothetical protein
MWLGDSMVHMKMLRKEKLSQSTFIFLEWTGILYAKIEWNESSVLFFRTK